MAEEQELLDEVEALNAIYGASSLVQAGHGSDIYILTLPEAAAEAEEPVSLRLHVPRAYPAAAAPSALGTHSAGGGQRGAGARDLALFRAALAAVYRPGSVCLFDAVEELRRLREEAGRHHDAASCGEGDAAAGGRRMAPPPVGAAAAAAAVASSGGLGPAPPWVLSDAVTELKSVFVARAASVTSPEQAALFVQHLLATDKRVRSATHNITAWRIRGPNGTSFQDCDDDGETAAGGRLLHLMQLMDLWDAMVVVTRWYGGQKLGPRRFALINTAARDAFVKAGLVEETAASKKKSHGK